MQKLTVGIAGLGLIGGSLAKALKKNTPHTVLGIDTDARTMQSALSGGAVDGQADAPALSRCDIVFVCLHPGGTVKFIKDNAPHFAGGALVCDVCGVKRAVQAEVEPYVRGSGAWYVGTHPMAGRERFGYEASDALLFEGASVIVCPPQDLPPELLQRLLSVLGGAGFAGSVQTDADEHDSIIAYTSQLAHAVSSAYIKSPAAEKQRGFSAGSYADMTRVARLDENMWTELFMLNRQNLIAEIDIFAANLSDIRSALEQGDENQLRQLLKKGREIKERSLRGEDIKPKDLE